MAEQLRVGKEITQKVKKADEESDDDIPVVIPEITDNPWLGSGAKQPDTPQEISSGYRKLWNTINASKEKKKELAGKDESSLKKTAVATDKPNIDLENAIQDESEDSESDGYVTDGDSDEETILNAQEMQNEFSEELTEGTERKKNIRDFENANSKTSSTPSSVRAKSNQSKWTVSDICPPKDKADTKAKSSGNDRQSAKGEMKKVANIDPNKFVTMENVVTLKSSVVSTEEGEDEQDEEEEAAALRRMTLAEAFADDDVVDQFKEEKKRVIDASAPKDIDLTLPGWGEWGGSGLKISKRKKRLFIIKAPPAPKRKDENMGHLIINDDQSEAMRKQRVNAIVKCFRKAV